MVSTQVTIEIEDYAIKCVLCAAFEGGVGYWCQISGYEYADGYEAQDFADGGKMQKKDDYWHRSQLVPLVEGCAVLCNVVGDWGEVDEEYDELRLDLPAIKRGLTLMSEKHPKQFALLQLNEGYAETGDVFLQYCLLGEVVFG